MAKFILFIFFAFFVSSFSYAQEKNDSVSLARSKAEASLPTDLHASFLIADPGLDFYSAYGHCVVRLQCPSKGLDLCHTYSLNENLENEVALFSGKGKGQYAAIKTPIFLKEYEEAKRGVKNYEINLTVEEIRNLWQILDEEMADGAYRTYNYLKTNCSSMSVSAVERCLGTSTIEWGTLSPGITGTYRDFVKTISEHRPWTGFFWTTILGHGGDELGDMEDKMGPTLIVPALTDAKIISAEGVSRSFLKGKPTMVLESGIEYKDWIFTPTTFFIAVLLLTIIASLLEWKRKGKAFVKSVDIFLLTMQTIAGVVIFYLSCISDMVGAAGNWNLLILNPLPFILWFVGRKRKWYNKVWMVYTIVILLYIVLWPISPQVDALRVLMASPLLVRCATRLVLTKTQNTK